MHQRLLGGIEAGANQHAVRAQHQGRREPAPVGDAAGGQHQRIGPAARAQVPDLGHQRERPAHRPVPARLGTLRDEDVRTGLDGAPGMGQRLHLADQGRAGGTYLLGERQRIAERQH